jgi:hypothetical protein
VDVDVAYRIAVDPGCAPLAAPADKPAGVVRAPSEPPKLGASERRR